MSQFLGEAYIIFEDNGNGVRSIKGQYFEIDNNGRRVNFGTKQLSIEDLIATFPTESEFLVQISNLTIELEALKEANDEADITIKNLQSQISNLLNNNELINGVPKSVTKAQAKLALYSTGLYDSAKQLAESAGGTTLLYWNEWSVWERNHPLIIQIGTALNLDSNGLDDLFIDAANY